MSSKRTKSTGPSLKQHSKRKASMAPKPNFLPRNDKFTGQTKARYPVRLDLSPFLSPFYDHAYGQNPIVDSIKRSQLRNKKSRKRARVDSRKSDSIKTINQLNISNLEKAHIIKKLTTKIIQNTKA